MAARRPIHVLVADGSGAKLWLAETPLGQLREIEAFSHPETRQHGADLTSDRPGRRFDADRRSKSGVGLGDPKAQEKIAFARELVVELLRRIDDGEIHKLYLVAAPNFLGILRREEPKRLSDLVAGEVSKALRDATADQVREALPYRL